MSGYVVASCSPHPPAHCPQREGREDLPAIRQSVSHALNLGERIEVGAKRRIPDKLAFSRSGIAHSVARLLCLAVLLTTLAGCGMIDLPFTPTAQPWQQIAPGLQVRTMLPLVDASAQLLVARIDPTQYRFRAIYRPGAAQSLAAWRAQEPDASLIVNANYFDSAGRAIGLVVSDGRAHGEAYRQLGGTLLVRNGEAAVVPNHAGLQLGGSEQAVQGYPLLVANGQQAFTDRRGAERNRRSVIAQDSQGRILVMIAPYLGPSLQQLSAFLASADLDIVTAFNLDGGRSTMLALPDADYMQPSLQAVPAILAVYKR